MSAFETCNTTMMADPSRIEAAVKGTPLAALLDSAAPAQREGVLVSLNMVAAPRLVQLADVRSSAVSSCADLAPARCPALGEEAFRISPPPNTPQPALFCISWFSARYYKPFFTSMILNAFLSDFKKLPFMLHHSLLTFRHLLF
ncbi:MAG: hypothetical protein WBX22_21350 [Silvibacterium sp.]